YFTDWIVAHVHIGALGWNGFMTFAILYWLIPRIYNTPLYSKKLASVHVWIGTLGILFYAIPRYWAAVVQGLMWKDFTPEGVLKYPNFLATTLEILPMHMMRALGGVFYLAGVIMMTYNLIKTLKTRKLVANDPAEAPALVPSKHLEITAHRRLEQRPVLFTV